MSSIFAKAACQLVVNDCALYVRLRILVFASAFASPIHSLGISVEWLWLNVKMF